MAWNDGGAGAVLQVLIDINMPVMNGFETLNRIQSSSELKHIPVILMSSDDGSSGSSGFSGASELRISVGFALRAV